jgi:hypothetical protein
MQRETKCAFYAPLRNLRFLVMKIQILITWENVFNDFIEPAKIFGHPKLKKKSVIFPRYCLQEKHFFIFVIFFVRRAAG